MATRRSRKAPPGQLEFDLWGLSEQAADETIREAAETATTTPLEEGAQEAVRDPAPDERCGKRARSERDARHDGDVAPAHGAHATPPPLPRPPPRAGTARPPHRRWPA